MDSRLWTRARCVALALPTLIRNRLRRRPVTAEPARILVAQSLLLGDTLMLAPLLAKLRARHPRAEIVLPCPPAFCPLFERQPWGVRAVAWDLRDAGSIGRLRRLGPFDLALVPADNRYAWLAAMAGSARIVAFAGDPRRLKNLPVTEFRAIPGTPASVGDLACALVDGPEPAAFAPGDWPAPEARPFETPAAPYAVLHLGASNPLRIWPENSTRELIRRLEQDGLQVVLACGKGEQALLDGADPGRRLGRYPGTLDLAQYWRLLAAARLLVCPDTGIAHLGRIAGTPTVTLFGQGSPVLFGAGRFWRNAPYRAVWNPATPCRDQKILFGKHIDWVQRCARRHPECTDPVCLRSVSVAQVAAAVAQLLAVSPSPP